jgi:hypothetical protein
MKTTTVATIMSKPEAQKCISEIKSIYAESHRAITARLLDLRDREGWRSLGYGSFSECAEIEFAELRYSPQELHKLADAEQIRRQTGLELVDAHALALKEVALEERCAVFEGAKKIAQLGGQTKPTAEHIEEAKRQHATHLAGGSSDERNESNGSKPSRQPVPNPPELEQEKALKRIGAVCGSALRTAIEIGTVEGGPRRPHCLGQRER